MKAFPNTSAPLTSGTLPRQSSGLIRNSPLFAGASSSFSGDSRRESPSADEEEEEEEDLKRLADEGEGADAEAGPLEGVLGHGEEGAGRLAEMGCADSSFFTSLGIALLLPGLSPLLIMNLWRVSMGAPLASADSMPKVRRWARAWLERPLRVSNQAPHSSHTCTSSRPDGSTAGAQRVRGQSAAPTARALMAHTHWIHLSTHS